ncbi:BfmA/BtgA family mobilization protein [Sphingobacterium kitahiroshimense]|uniref:BfmA/BtgA family mobilization protein n=1 Tax=Sphingobacterium kitahiroshimense TaxID=470446 RepID=UPI0032085239
MNKKNDSAIRLTEATKQRLKAFNKSNSYEENLVILLEYFDRTGINPSSLKEHPIDVTMKGFDRMIAILKSIEKTKIDVSMKKLIDIEKLLSPLAEYVQNAFEQNSNNSNNSKILGNVIGENEDQITEEELKAIVEMNLDLNNKIDDLEEELRKKNQQIFELSNSDSNGKSEESVALKQNISTIAKRLEEGARKASFGNDYTIKLADYNFIIQSLKNIIR